MAILTTSITSIKCFNKNKMSGLSGGTSNVRLFIFFIRPMLKM